MKRNILNKNIAAIALILYLISCDDLEENPIGLLAPESYFKTEVEVEAAVMGVYSRFAREPLYGRRLPLTIMLLGDDCDIGDLGTAERRIHMNNFIPDANNGLITTFWPEIYLAIQAANSAINGAESIPNSERVNALIAEARFLRAHCYYNLVQLFGDIPYIDEFITDPASVASISKTKEEEVYQTIIADCEYAEQNLPDNYSNGIRCRPTKGSAKTMLASVYLTLGQYDKAAQYAEEVINNASTYGYRLVDDFTELWKADNGDMEEHIWTVDFKAGTNTFTNWWAPMTGVMDADMQGWSVVVPSSGLYDLYEPGDHRMEATFITETPIDEVMVPFENWTIPRIHFGKFALYPGDGANSDGSNSGRNYPIYRFAEVYLIAAEALAEVNNGPTAKAYEYINKVRERARFNGTVPADLVSGMTKAEFINAVLKERLLEFPLEYKRWFDIKRRQLGEEVFEGPNSIEPHNFDPAKNYLLPLPQDELDRNPNLLPQNTGY
jgi:tetratricopeptide (TPR) repeat protein